MLNLDAGFVVSQGDKLDLDSGRQFRVAAEIPGEGQTMGRLLNGHSAPIVLNAVGGSLVESPARFALEVHLCLGIAAKRVTSRPPAVDLFRPHSKGVCHS